MPGEETGASTERPSSLGDPAALEALVAVANQTIGALRRRVETALADLAQLEAERLEHAGAQAALGELILRAQGQVEQERREAATTVQAIASDAEQAVSRILADAHAEVQALVAALEGMGVVVGHEQGRVLAFPSEPAGAAAEDAQRPCQVRETDTTGDGRVAVTS